MSRRSFAYRCSACLLALASAVLVCIEAIAVEQARVANTVTLAENESCHLFASGGWAAYDGRQIRFHAPDGSTIKALTLQENQSVTGPEEGAILAVVSYTAESPEAVQVADLELFNTAGERVLEFKSPDFSSVIISPSGTGFVGVKGAEGLRSSLLRFYTAAGIERGTIAVEHFEGGQFSEDGSRFFYQTAGQGLQSATGMGQPLFTYGIASVWGASDDGHTVALSTDEAIRFFRDSSVLGEINWSAEAGVARMIALSPDGGHALLITATHTLLYRTDSVSVVWTRPVDSPGWNFHTADLTIGAERIALGLDYDPGTGKPERHRKSRVLILDSDGTLTAASDATPTSWGARFPLVRFSATGGKLHHLDRDAAQIIEVE